jgi:hypothetical protein
MMTSLGSGTSCVSISHSERNLKVLQTAGHLEGTEIEYPRKSQKWNAQTGARKYSYKSSWIGANELLPYVNPDFGRKLLVRHE